MVSRDSAIDLGAAFPATLRAAAAEVASIMPWSRLRPAAQFTVHVGDDALSIPYRIYNDEPSSESVQRFSLEQRLILACVYTRHHDGHVRQRHAEAIVEHAHGWVVPYVVQLLGEYVAEVVLAVRTRLAELEIPGTPMHAAYGRFAAANGPFMALTWQRAASYWDCYYRNRYADRRFYPSFEILAAIRDATARDF